MCFERSEPARRLGFVVSPHEIGAVGGSYDISWVSDREELDDGLSECSGREIGLVFEAGEDAVLGS